MKNEKSIAVVGGDGRMALVARMLEGRCKCKYFAATEEVPFKPEDISGYGTVVLPVPCSFDGVRLNCGQRAAPTLAEIASRADGGTLFGGKLPEDIRKLCAEKGVKTHDLLEDEALLIKNARLTAEGALEAVLRETESAVLGASLLVVGFGRVGQATAGLLSACGARVTVAARSEAQLALAGSMGLCPVRLAELEANKDFSAILNTVPHAVLDIGILSRFPKGIPFIELASGASYSSAAEKAGLKLVNAQGLPGKTAPVSAATIIYERISDLLGIDI